MAEGIVRKFPGTIKPVVQFLIDRNINIMQMPCPETLCVSGGLGREPHGKKWYEEHGLRDTSKEIAKGQVAYMMDLIERGSIVLAIIGMEFSPACAVSYLNRGRSIVKGEGIYVEEIKVLLEEHDLDIPFIGISQRWNKKMIRDLFNLWERQYHLVEMKS